jgi:hypothetical protein
MRTYFLLATLVVLAPPPAHPQQLPQFDVKEICEAGAAALSSEECGRDQKSFVCDQSGRSVTAALCSVIDNAAKVDVAKRWDSVPFNQKRACIMYSLSSLYLSYGAIQRCLDEQTMAEPIDGPDFIVEYWYEDSRIVIPHKTFQDCFETNAHSGYRGSCMPRTQICTSPAANVCSRG